MVHSFLHKKTLMLFRKQNMGKNCSVLGTYFKNMYRTYVYNFMQIHVHIICIQLCVTDFNSLFVCLTSLYNKNENKISDGEV